MDDGRAALLRLHQPSKSYRVRLGHLRAFDQSALGVCEILLRGCGSASAKRGAQTGHRAAMSYPRLVGHTDHAQAGGEKFLDQISFFVIERGAAEMADRCGVIDIRSVHLSATGRIRCGELDECALARFPNAIRHHVHRSIKRDFRPLLRARRAIFHFRLATGMSEQLIRGGAFWAKISLTDRAFRIALDRNQLPVLAINELAATYPAIRTN